MVSLTVNDNGRHYTGTTWEDLLTHLHKDQLVPERNDMAYMRAVARRVKMWNKVLVRTDTAENFLRDLAAQNLVHLNNIL